MADINFYSGIDITGNINVSGSFYDTSGSPGASGSILSSTLTGTAWINPNTLDNIANTDLTLTGNRILYFGPPNNTNKTLEFKEYTGGSSYRVIKFTDAEVEIAKEVHLKSASATAVPLHFHGPSSSAFSVSFQAPSLLSSTAYTLPDADGTNKQSLTTNGSAELSWLDAINIGNNNLTIPGTNTARTLTLSGGSSSSFAIETSSNDPYIHLEKAITNVYKQLRIKPDTARTGGVLQLWEGTAGGTDYIGLQPPSAVTTSVTYTLPEAPSTTGFVLSSTTAGVMSWVANGGTDTNIGTDNLTIDDVNRTLTLNSDGFSTFSILDTSGGTIAEFSDGSNKFVDPVNIQNVPSVVGSLFIWDQNNTNYIGFDVPFNTNNSILYTLPEPPTTDGQILASQTDGTMSWQDSAPTPTLVMGGGGSVAITTTSDDSNRFIVCGGSTSRGFNYYDWSLVMFNGAPSFTGIGVTVGATPSTSTVTPYLANNGVFRCISEGNVRLQGTVTGVNHADIYDSDVYIYVFKVPASVVTLMGNGGAQSNVAYTLVASAKCTMPSSDAVTRPQSFSSSNGVSITKQDYIFAAVAFDATVTTTRKFIVNFNVYTE